MHFRDVVTNLNAIVEVDSNSRFTAVFQMPKIFLSQSHLVGERHVVVVFFRLQHAVNIYFSSVKTIPPPSSVFLKVHLMNGLHLKKMMRRSWF